ncbi:MAG: hypothetical protein AAGB46_20030 [Verrucomicrobiota bacterium]
MLKKILIGLFVFALLVGVGAYFGAQALVKKGSEQVLVELEKATEGKAVEIVRPKIADAKVSFMPTGVEWSGFSAEIRVPGFSEVWGSGSLDTQFESIKVEAGDSNYESVVVDVRNGLLKPLGTTKRSEEFELKSFAIKELALPIALSADRPEESVSKLISELSAFVAQGSTTSPIAMEGVVDFMANGQARQATLRSVQEGDEYFVEIDRGDLKAIAAGFDGEWSDATIDVVARHPLQAPALMYLTEYSVQKSKAMKADDPSLPEDAYRHVLWSYLLTQRVGEKLAKKVTDSHEVGSTTNTAADHEMDYHNNAVGRMYAQQGKSEDDLVRLVKTDPAVIRTYP